MAVYRRIHITFWEDGDMEELTPEGRYFYLCLLTNPRTNQSGIYEITIKQLVVYTGYNRETVLHLLDRFEEMGRIQYSMETRELAIRNWPKWNMSRSEKVIKNVLDNLAGVKNRDLVRWVYGGRDNWNNTQMLQWYENGMDTVSIEYPQKEEEKEEEETKEKGRKSPRFTAADHKLAMALFEQVQGTGRLSPKQMEKVRIESWAETIRLMREQDGLTPEQIAKAILYLRTAPVQNDFCWSWVVLSAENLRKHLKGNLYGSIFGSKPRTRAVGENTITPDNLEKSETYRKLLAEQGRGAHVL